MKDRKESDSRYYENNKDKINAKRRQRLRDDAEYRAEIYARTAECRKRILSDPKKKAEFNRKSREWQRNHYKSEDAKIKRAAKQKKWYDSRSEESKARKLETRRQRARECTAKLVKELGGRCIICGLEDHSVVYDFHHVDPSTKKFAISQMAGGLKWERMLAEAQKCALLCAICHRKLHFGLVSLNESKSQQSNRNVEDKDSSPTVR